jgi:hypothetical protein
MHLYLLMHVVFWWAAKIAASTVFVSALKAAWKAITAWFTSPPWVPPFSFEYAESHLLRNTGIILLLVGLVVAGILIGQRQARMALPTAC